MTGKDILVRARGVIADPANWKQGGIAEFKDGKIQGPFCALGALGRAGGILRYGYSAGPNRNGTAPILVAYGEANVENQQVVQAVRDAHEVLSECLPAPIHEYNDSHDHKCVLAAFDAAIERAE